MSKDFLYECYFVNPKPKKDVFKNEYCYGYVGHNIEGYKIKNLFRIVPVMKV